MPNYQNQTWFQQEASNIQKKIKVSAEEAQTILEQRINEYAQNNGMTKEDAAAHYQKIQHNTKVKKV